MSNLIREHHEDRESWLSARANRGIGGSEAAAIVNMSPYDTVRDLWERKVLGKKAPNVSDNEYVAKGVRVEPVLRALYQANHPEVTVEYYPFDLLYQQERPWAFSTLDGEILKPDGKHGILEIKTAAPSGKEGWKKWDGQIPMNYFAQTLWQLATSGFDFVVLYAGLYSSDGSMTIREYEFSRDEVSEDIEWLMHEADEFWDSVTNHKLPPLTLVI